MSRLAVALLSLTLSILAGCGLLPGLRGEAAVTVALGGSARQAAPSTVESFSLTVEGPDMEPLSGQYPAGTESVTLLVPAGADRVFSVTASPGPSAPPTLLGYSGSAVQDLAAGVDTTVQIRMRRRTTLVIPDNFNARLVQIDSLSGANWQEEPTPGGLMPWDVDFDAQGRIYVIEDDNAYSGEIVRMDDVHRLNAALLVSDAEAFPRALAVDASGDVLYYYAQNYGSIQKYVVSTETNSIFGYNPGGPVTGMDLDDAGFLYVVVDQGGGTSSVVKVDVAAEQAVASRPYAGQLAMDVLAKDGFVYAAVRDSAAGGTQHRVEQLAPDLSLVSTLTNAGVGGALIGPIRFVSPLNSGITLMEENVQLGTDQVVGFADISGSGFAAYGSSGDGGVGRFEFFVNSNF